MTVDKVGQDVHKLKDLMYLKNIFEKQLNFQISLYVKKDKINKIFEDKNYCTFDDGCTLEFDMRRTNSIIDNLDSKIYDLLENYDLIDSNDKYAKFILEKHYYIK